jgi:hypothetical protein
MNTRCLAAQPDILEALLFVFARTQSPVQAMFDPQLIVPGPLACAILDLFDSTDYRTSAVLYPLAVGSPCAQAAYLTFRRSDLS